MNCKEFKKLIPDFLERKMDFLLLEEFNEHRNSCKDCQEELEIRFLVTEGIQRLEDGSAFDLQNDLKRRYDESERTVRFHKSFLYIGETLEALGMIGILGIVLWIILS